MKKSIKNCVTMFALSILISGCAASYKPIILTNINFPNSQKNNGVEFSYKYEVIKDAGNKKYAKKEANSNKKVAAIKITNNSDSSLIIGKDIIFFAGQTRINPLSPEEVKTNIKQNVAGYLPYALLTILKLKITKDYQTKTYDIGYILGPLITVLNMGNASGSNKRFVKNLKDYSVNNNEIRKGETFYGLMGVSEPGYQTLSVKLKSEL